MLALLVLLCVPVIVLDTTARRIPNTLLFAVTALTLLWLGSCDLSGVAATQAAPVSVWSHLAGGLLGGVVLLPFWRWNLMGAGDVKLFAVIGLIAGHATLLPVWWLASLAAGVHAAATLLWRRPFARTWRERTAGWAWVRRMHAWREGRQGIPYGAYLAAAALLVKL
ncbi:peptidase A24A prepilin type IV [Pandoraea terrae]|uniref:Peptidase A24A prepilin type IV n=1 Tax=Pandoraea terrae TaxID=1537710 RepID=A0A5E4Z6X1_9BURK|nr:prepilin peptidase [Pandoraea terrae]VVE56508.1 peptidase A24A prepilin type IV [Pandoraea terrae]